MQHTICIKNEPADGLESQIAQARQRPSFTTLLELMQAIDTCATGPRRVKRVAAPTDDEIEATLR